MRFVKQWALDFAVAGVLLLVVGFNDFIIASNEKDSLRAIAGAAMILYSFTLFLNARNLWAVHKFDKELENEKQGSDKKPPTGG